MKTGPFGYLERNTSGGVQGEKDLSLALESVGQ